MKEYTVFFNDANSRLNEIKENYKQLDEDSKSEYDGLKNMFEMLSKVDLEKL